MRRRSGPTQNSNPRSEFPRKVLELRNRLAISKPAWNSSINACWGKHRKLSVSCKNGTSNWKLATQGKLFFNTSCIYWAMYRNGLAPRTAVDCCGTLYDSSVPILAFSRGGRLSTVGSTFVRQGVQPALDAGHMIHQLVLCKLRLPAAARQETDKALPCEGCGSESSAV